MIPMKISGIHIFPQDSIKGGESLQIPFNHCYNAYRDQNIATSFRNVPLNGIHIISPKFKVAPFLFSIVSTSGNVIP